MADVSPRSSPLRDVSQGEMSFSSDELGETSAVHRLYYIVICWLHAGAVSVLSVGWVQWLPDSTSHPQYKVGMPKWRVIRWTPTSLGKRAKPPHQMNTNIDRVTSELQNKWPNKWKTYEFEDPTKPSTRGLRGKFQASTSIPSGRVKREGC